ncbi:MAG: hypothetical protein CMB29_03125, partial [Euryarchaeota archaeon]|nr:hypothetical protein [Euryarchaeota archaeon]
HQQPPASSLSIIDKACFTLPQRIKDDIATSNSRVSPLMPTPQCPPPKKQITAACEIYRPMHFVSTTKGHLSIAVQCDFPGLESQ